MPCKSTGSDYPASKITNIFHIHLWTVKEFFISIPFTYYGPSLWSVRVCNPSALGVHYLVNAARKTAISAENAAAFTLALLSEADFV